MQPDGIGNSEGLRELYAEAGGKEGAREGPRKWLDDGFTYLICCRRCRAGGRLDGRPWGMPLVRC
jgi:hypothetical protein